MPFIEIITDQKSQAQLNKVITKKMVNNCDVLYIKEKNIENTKNIKLETLILNRKIENDEIINKILENSKNAIVNMDLNIDKNLKLASNINNNKINNEITNKDLKTNNSTINKIKTNIITFGYNSKSDITVSSIEDEQILICIQNTITSIYNRKIEPQEIKVNVKPDMNIYNIMIIIALTSLYAI